MNLTIKDIAKMANVSYTTVSRALNGSNQVSEETRNRVLEICKKVGYSPNAIARGLVTNSTNTIGLLVPDITNPFYPEVALGVEDEALSRGYSVFLCNTGFNIDRMESYFKLLIEKRVEGLIIASVPEEAKDLFELYHKRLPIVYIGSRPDNNRCNYVTTDNFKAGYIATDYLVKLGHKKIAFIGGIGISNSYREKLQGFKAVMEKNGIIPDIELIRNYHFNRIESGYLITKLMLKENKIPTAIIGANDLVALGAIQACEEMGFSIPDDISVIGFDDISYVSLPKINLTTVAQPKYDLGKLAVDIIFKARGSNLEDTFFKEILEPKLIERTSCKQI